MVMTRRLTNREVKGLIRQPRILNKFYIYDPNAPDLLGGLRVMEEKDDKGNVKEGRRHVLAVQQQVQYWIDQGLMGEKPVGEISGAHKKLLTQLTRGRSEDNDVEPSRAARLSRRLQSGHPSLVASTIHRKKKSKDKKNAKKAPAPATKDLKPPTPPSRA